MKIWDILVVVVSIIGNVIKVVEPDNSFPGVLVLVSICMDFGFLP